MAVVLVTGSSRGIGKAIAREFLAHGHRVVINARKSERELLDTKKEFEKLSGSLLAFMADVSLYDEAKKMFQQIESTWEPVNILVNNAGISYYGLFQDMSPADWQNVFQNNFSSALNCTHLAIPPMVRQHTGNIINISSIWGTQGASMESVYAASKGALNVFTKSLAKELGPTGIRVNGISCGMIDTEMNSVFSSEEKNEFIDNVSLGRTGKPEEVATLAYFLAGRKSSYISGEIIKIDGCIY